MYLKTPPPQQLAPTSKMIQLLDNVLSTTYFHGRWLEALFKRWACRGLWAQSPNAHWGADLIHLFLQSTPLIKKLHFRGERFLLTGCGLNPYCFLPSLVLVSERRHQTIEVIKYFPLVGPAPNLKGVPVKCTRCVTKWGLVRFDVHVMEICGDLRHTFPSHCLETRIFENATF